MKPQKSGLAGNETVVSSKPSLSVSFHNFWRRFDAKASFFAKALGQSYDVTIQGVGRDLQISSVFDNQQLPIVPGGRPLRVWWTGEPRDPRGQIFDLHFGFQPTSILGSRWYRYPLWITYIDWWNPDSPHHVSKLLRRDSRPRTRFCNFIYRSDPSIRTEFFLRLNEARPVGSFGGVLNNAGQTAKGLSGKMRVLAESVFTIAFENQIAPGYVTEKLVEPLLAGSIPIYWGAAEAKADFNPDAFVFADDFASLDDLVTHVLRLADSPDAVRALASAPPFRDNRVRYEHTPAYFVDRISDALSGNVAGGIPERWRGLWNPNDRGLFKSIERGVRRLRNRMRG